MRYAIFHFSIRQRGGELSRNLCAAVVDRDCQCIVTQATTVEDEHYLGTDWQCDHCLPPTECTVCNPAYRDAYIAPCPDCIAAEGLSLQTWHDSDGNCLKCKEK